MNEQIRAEEKAKALVEHWLEETFPKIDDLEIASLKRLLTQAFWNYEYELENLRKLLRRVPDDSL